MSKYIPKSTAGKLAAGTAIIAVPTAAGIGLMSRKRKKD